MQPTNWSRPPGNKVCLYCNERFDGSTVVPTKEHLVGRNFVPRGSFDGGRGFNFIFDACQRCNNDKSRLEAHVSAVTQFMSPNIAEDSAFAHRAIEKSKREHHPWTGRPVADSFHESTIRFQGRGIGISTTFRGPPQVDRWMLNRLALRHVQGLFAMVTNPEPTEEQLTVLYPGWVYVLGEYVPGDWGNSQVMAAFERTRGWTRRARVITANGYFKGMLRRDDREVGTWFWALEWNQYMRVVGGIAYDGQLPSFMRDLPQLCWSESRASTGAMFRARREEPLNEARDHLFAE